MLILSEPLQVDTSDTDFELVVSRIADDQVYDTKVVILSRKDNRKLLLLTLLEQMIENKEITEREVNRIFAGHRGNNA